MYIHMSSQQTLCWWRIHWLCWCVAVVQQYQMYTYTYEPQGQLYYFPSGTLNHMPFSYIAIDNNTSISCIPITTNNTSDCSVCICASVSACPQTHNLRYRSGRRVTASRHRCFLYKLFNLGQWPKLSSTYFQPLCSLTWLPLPRCNDGICWWTTFVLLLLFISTTYHRAFDYVTVYFSSHLGTSLCICCRYWEMTVKHCHLLELLQMKSLIIVRMSSVYLQSLLSYIWQNLTI